MKYGTNTDVTESGTWQPEEQPEECNLFDKENPGAHTVDIKTHLQTYQTGLKPASLQDGILISSTSNGIDWTKRGNTEIRMHIAKEVAAFSAKLKPGFPHSPSHLF